MAGGRWEDPPTVMETMLTAVARLRSEGFDADLSALAGARLRCDRCGRATPVADASVFETVRFEGVSNPADEQILIALVPGCEHPGLFRSAYGLSADPDSADVLRSLDG